MHALLVPLREHHIMAQWLARWHRIASPVAGDRKQTELSIRNVQVAQDMEWQSLCNYGRRRTGNLDSE